MEIVLVVDDEPDIRTVVRSMLTAKGYTVLETGDPQQAIRMATQQAVHLLITDVVMPRVGGATLAREIAPMRPETRVLYISGYTDDALVHHGFLETELSFLEKPFSPVRLARKVRELIDKTKKPSFGPMGSVMLS
jgi:DNA-binding NtrC family response regulator